MNKNGFTLSEVLITLGVIGVVLAITMPILIKNYQRFITVKKLKSSYSVFAQALQRSVADNGDIRTWDRSNPRLYAEKYFNMYLKGVNKSSNYYVTSLHYPTHNNLYWYQSGNYPIYELPNGITFIVRDGIGTASRYIVIMVDINGSKKPNIVGKDVFAFLSYMDNPDRLDGFCVRGESRDAVKNNGLTGAHYSACSKTVKGVNSFAGLCCAGLIMHDGWKIKDDYPW